MVHSHSLLWNMTFKCDSILPNDSLYGFVHHSHLISTDTAGIHRKRSRHPGTESPASGCVQNSLFLTGSWTPPGSEGDPSNPKADILTRWDPKSRPSHEVDNAQGVPPPPHLFPSKMTPLFHPPALPSRAHRPRTERSLTRQAYGPGGLGICALRGVPGLEDCRKRPRGVDGGGASKCVWGGKRFELL